MAYEEAGFTTSTPVADVSVAAAGEGKATLSANAACRAQWAPMPGASCDAGRAHVILAVTDDGSPSLTSYRRVIVTVRNGAPKRP